MTRSRPESRERQVRSETSLGVKRVFIAASILRISPRVAKVDAVPRAPPRPMRPMRWMRSSGACGEGRSSPRERCHRRECREQPHRLPPEPVNHQRLIALALGAIAMDARGVKAGSAQVPAKRSVLCLVRANTRNEPASCRSNFSGD